MTTPQTQTNLAEVSRIVGDCMIGEVQSLIKKVIDGREQKRIRSMEEVARIKKGTESMNRAAEESLQQVQQAKCQMESLEPELIRAREALARSAEFASRAKINFNEKQQQHDDAKKELDMIKTQRKEFVNAYNSIFGIIGVKLEVEVEEIEIDIKLDQNDNKHFTIICSKDRARKRGLYLQVNGVEPQLPGFDELERAYVVESMRFVELVMKCRQLARMNIDKLDDF